MPQGDASLKFEARNTTINDLLYGSNKRYVIPRFQRPYSWGEDELQDFWDDLLQEGGERTDLFLGSMIFNYNNYKLNGEIEVVDGQQRLISLMILNAALRDVAQDYDEKLAELIHTQDIAIRDREGKDTWRVLPGESIIEKYIKHVVSSNREEFPIDISAEERRLKIAYNYFRNRIIEYLDKIDSAENRKQRLRQLREYVANIQIVAIDIYSEEAAYEIFEAMNAKGIDLSVADLIKNLIFKNLIPRGEKDEAKEIWDEITTNIESTNTEMKKFIRYSWISTRTILPEKRLYRVVKKDVHEWSEYLLQLHIDSELYNMLLVGDNRKEYESKKYRKYVKIYDSIQAINIMGVQQPVLLLLSLFRNSIPEIMDVSRYLQMIENFIFVYFAVSKLPANRVERLFARYAIQLHQATVKSTSDKDKRKAAESIMDKLTNELHQIKPSQDIFIENFMNVKYKNSTKARMLIKYILAKIENYKSDNREKIIDFDNVNIEHLLPKNPKKWDLTKRDVKGYVDLLGNLTLVDRKLNSGGGNEPLEKKLEILKRSNIAITKELVAMAEKRGWDEQAIRERQREFAEMAYTKIWVL